MPHTLADRAVTTSPLPLLRSRDARVLGIRVPGPGYLRVRPGVYVDEDRWNALAPWQRYQVRVHAFLLTCPDAIVCLESAAVVLGLPLFGHPRDIHVYDPARGASRRYGDVSVHTSADPREVVETGGIRVTSLLDTALDLARVLPPEQGIAVTAAAVSPAQGGTSTLTALRERARDQQSRRGTAILPQVFALSDDRLESPHEAVSYAVIVWSGFEWPEPQVEYRYEGQRDRCDFTFPSVRGSGQADGWGKYDLGNPVAAADALRREKRREDRLRRYGHRIARWEPSDAFRVEPVCRALKLMEVPLRRAPRTALLATVGRGSSRTVRTSEKPHPW